MGPAGWVFTYDAIFELLFALITLGIGFFALKIHSFSGQRSIKFFGLSFLSISASFFALSFLNFGLNKLASGITGLEPSGLLRLILASHMGLYVIGVITLAYMTLKVRNDRTYYMLLAVTFIVILMASQKLYLFYAICSVLLGYVFIYYLGIFAKKKQLKNFLVMLGFCFLFLGNVSLIFSVDNSFYYTLGHCFQLVGFSSLLANFAMVLFK